jgi:hypothetical protein
VSVVVVNHENAELRAPLHAVISLKIIDVLQEEKKEKAGPIGLALILCLTVNLWPAL